MQPVIASLVEGRGEEGALRPLIHNIITSAAGAVYPHILRPRRMHRGTMVNTPGELERCAADELATAGPAGRLLVLLDADGDCPAELGPQLRRRLDARFPSHTVSVNIADWEYESWFIASAESIARHTGTAGQYAVPQNIEAIRDAKGWVERYLMMAKYNPQENQAAFSARIDVPLARRRSQSFNRFCREIERLLTA